MKYMVEDLSSERYVVCVTDTLGKALELAKEYVKWVFEEYDKMIPELKKHFHKDIRDEDLVGISISTVNYNEFNKIRTNYFYGHIKRNGEVVNTNEECL